MPYFWRTNKQYSTVLGAKRKIPFNFIPKQDEQRQVQIEFKLLQHFQVQKNNNFFWETPALIVILGRRFCSYFFKF
jgi:hypothetical protein